MKHATEHEVSTETAERPRPPLSIRLSDELDAQLKAACEITRMKRSDVARFSLEKGIPLFVEQMTGASAA